MVKPISTDQENLNFYFHLSVYLHKLMRAYIHTYIYTGTHICIYVCVYAYISTNTHKHRKPNQNVDCRKNNCAVSYAAEGVKYLTYSMKCEQRLSTE